MRRVLIVSPIPSEPRNQGNAARIAVVGEILQSAGCIVHFLYHKLEGLARDQADAMARCWDHVHTMDGPPREPYRPESGPMSIDDWYDPRLSDFAAALHRRWAFAAVLVNYVWCSAVLDALPEDVVKILDTHDVFGDRDAVFRAMGLEPAWYWTTPAEEAIGLGRAHIVLAIQETEAETFRQRGHNDVRVLGHLLPLRSRSIRAERVRAPHAGYLASGNPLNVLSFLQLRDAVRTHSVRATVGRLVLAGTICPKIDDPAPFELLGPVAEADTFYDACDVVLNPMAGGSGLKIKSVEAVHRGIPLIATESAMVGLPVTHDAHRLAGAEDVARFLLESRFDKHVLLALSAASEEIARLYRSSVNTAYRVLVASVAT